jgi:type IV pilus assembly protein PilC
LLFYFKAKNDDGTVVEGEREGADRLSLAHELKKENLLLISIEPMRSKRSGALFSLKRVSMRDKILLAGNLSSMITAGLSLSRALDVLARQAGGAYLKSVIKALTGRVNAGESLSQAMIAYPNVFSNVFSSMVAAGEQSGKLPEALNIVRDQMQKTYELGRKIKGAMIYPGVILTAMAAIVILMMIFLVPTLTATFKDLHVQLPFLTRVIIGTSDLFVAHYLLLPILAVAIIAGVIFASKSRSGRRFTDWATLRLPLVGGMVKEYNSAIIMRTLSSLISSGVSMIESLQITEQVVQNSFYKTLVKDAADKVQKGVNLSSLFKAEEGRLFPILVGELTLVGEETGQLPEMLLKGALFFEDEVDQLTKNLSTIVEPVLMIVIGVAVGFFVVALISPMYSLSNAF